MADPNDRRASERFPVNRGASCPFLSPVAMTGRPPASFLLGTYRFDQFADERIFSISSLMRNFRRLMSAMASSS